MKTKILLTGAGGMVGRNILEHPDIGDFEMLAPRSNELNLLDLNALQAYLKRHKTDMVIHAAGKVGGIQANMREPVSFLMENLDMGRNVVWGARQAGIKRLINLGSSCMYPRNHTEPLSEELVLQGELEPTNEGYALAKIMALRLCQYIRHETPAMQYKTLIPCNLYGRYDSFDPATSHMVPAVIAKLHAAREAGQQTMDIWGDGTARREFMYAGDLAGAVLRAAADIEALPDLMNIGVGHDHSITDYYKTAAGVVGWDGTFTHDLSKPTGMQQKLCDTSRQQDWGWAPQTDLAAGMALTYEFFLERAST
mgnify:CR=1 FL=1